MKIVIAPDSFKGSLSAAGVVEAVAEGIRESAPGAVLIAQPLSDGGEGTLDVLVHHGFEIHTVTVPGSWGEPVVASFASRDGVVVIESAQAFGFLPGATASQALEASSAGVGQVIREALESDPAEILLTVGGTSGTDGGFGMLRVLGARGLDNQGYDIGQGGGALLTLDSVDLTGLDPRLSRTRVRVLTDVTNPLLGSTGAAAVFAPQKGADPEAVALLDAGLARLAALVGQEMADRPGTGAGGGLAFAAMAALGASQESGATAMMEITGLGTEMKDANLVVTGEGSFDAQSLGGKITGAVIERARSQNIPVVVVCGVSPMSAELSGVTVIEISASAPSIQESIDNPELYLREAGRTIGGMITEGL
jgi:glycerate 2-kinase